ncbi:MAG: hypothetical protein IPH28_21515 [Cytophagaceae bacterium]|nr:hypothetical protein [Cytophagaceae bacterium]
MPKEKLTELDRWIISKVNTLIKKVSEEFDNYNPTKAGRLVQILSRRSFPTGM